MSRSLITLSLILALTATGCTWVKPTPGGEKVRILSAEEVGACQELGKTTASLRDKVLGINRAAAKVQWELRTLASNSAANMGGDTIVPVTPIKDGQQTFAVYKCVGVK